MRSSPATLPKISLRAVQLGDLPILCDFQLDPAATRMADFPARPPAAFMAHWTKIMATPGCILRTILYGESIAGNVQAWTHEGDRMVGYWIGREYWGRGIASAALALYLQEETIRPLLAHVVKHNAASIRVLTKCGFLPAGEEIVHRPTGEMSEGLIFRLK